MQLGSFYWKVVNLNTNRYWQSADFDPHIPYPKFELCAIRITIAWSVYWHILWSNLFLQNSWLIGKFPDSRIHLTNAGNAALTIDISLGDSTGVHQSKPQYNTKICFLMLTHSLFLSVFVLSFFVSHILNFRILDLTNKKIWTSFHDGFNSKFEKLPAFLWWLSKALTCASKSLT